MRKHNKTGVLVLVAGVVGLAVGLPLGAVLFDGDGSESRRAGSFSVISPVVLSTTCQKRLLDFGGASLVETEANSRFRLPGTGTVRSRIIFYRDGEVISIEPWSSPNYRTTDGTYGNGYIDWQESAPDRVRAEWQVGKEIYPMFASC